MAHILTSYNRNGDINSNFNLDKLYSLVSRSTKDIIYFLQDLGLLAKEYHCPRCGENMKMVSVNNCSDGHAWECRDRSNSNSHKIIRSIRKGTWFNHSQLTLREILLITYMWVKKFPYTIIVDELKISHHTATDWCNFAREVCVETLLAVNVKIGGPGKIIEIDESKFGKRKYNKGKCVEGQWVFGGVCRETSECFLETVEDRSTSETLLNIIKKRILPGTTIYSDCWKAYNCLQNEGYVHLTVNHSITFKDAETGVHTNTIEGIWALAKENMPSKNRQKLLFNSYLCEFMYRHMVFKDDMDTFIVFLKDTEKIYPPQTFDIDDK